MSTVAEKLAELRHSRNLSRERLAELVGIPSFKLTALEAQRVRPTASDLAKIGDALQLTPAERAECFELIGYPLYPSGSFLSGGAHNLIELQLRSIRGAHGWSPTEFADVINVPREELHKSLSDLIPPTSLLRRAVDEAPLSESERVFLVDAWAFQTSLLTSDAENGSMLLLFSFVDGQGQQSGSELVTDARTMVASLGADLGLSRDEIALVFDASSDEVAAWLDGQRLPLRVISRTIAYRRAIRVLLNLFEPERLPNVIRRQSKLFEGDSALDWIVRGRLPEVAEKYERILQYAQ